MREKTLNVRVTEEEKRKLTWKAKQSGLSVSGVLRAGGLELDITEDARLKAQKETLGSFNKTGNLIDQIAEGMNKGRLPNNDDLRDKLDRVISSFDRLLAEVEKINDR